MLTTSSTTSKKTQQRRKNITNTSSTITTKKGTAADSTPSPHSIQTLLAQFEQWIVSGKKIDKTEKGNSLSQFETNAKEYGLNGEQLVQLMGIVVADKLDEMSTKRLIKCLYPRTTVPFDCILSIVGYMAHKKNHSRQQSLLRWIILVSELVQDTKRLRSLYSVFFHYLGHDLFRPYVCQILSLLTTQDQIKPFRIRHLLHLHEQFPTDIHIVNLLHHYQLLSRKSFTLPSLPSVFKCPDPIWHKQLMKIQSRFEHKRVSAQVYGTSQKKDVLQDEEEEDDNNALINFIAKVVAQNDYTVLNENRQCIDNWIRQRVNDSAHQSSVLRLVLLLTKLTKRLSPLFEDFVTRILADGWDGVRNKDVIWELITYVDVRPFDELTPTLFQPIYRLFTKSSSLTTDIIICLNRLLRHWAVSSTGAKDVQPIQDLATFVDHLCLELLRNTSTTPSYATNHAILSFFETTASLLPDYDIPTIYVPSSGIIYHFLLSNNGVDLSRICGILAKYKTSFEEQERHGQVSDVDRFNGFVMDFCNTIWRSRALNKTDQNAVGLDIDDETIGQLNSVCEERGQSLLHAFSITHSGAMGYFAYEFMEKLVPSQSVKKPITLASVKELNLSYMDVRIAFLNSLKERGFTGLYAFLYGSMASLMNRQQKQ